MNSCDSPSILFWDELRIIKVCCILKKGKKRGQTTQAMSKRSHGAQGPAGHPVPGAGLPGQEQRGPHTPLPLPTLAEVTFPATSYLSGIWENRNCPILQDPTVCLNTQGNMNPHCSQQRQGAGQGHPYVFLAYLNQHLLPIDEDLGNAVTHSINWCYWATPNINIWNLRGKVLLN